MDLCVNLRMAKETKKAVKKKTFPNITVKTNLTADQLLILAINTPVKKKKRLLA